MRETLLLIDDDDLSREILTLLLEDAGYTVVPAASGDIALTALREAAGPPRISAVLTDMQMPGTSGSELARLLRQQLGPDARILAMSGSTVPPASLRGFDGFLLKPLSVADLRGLLESSGVKRDGAVPDRTEDHEKPSGRDGLVAKTPVLEEKTFQELCALMRPSQVQELLTLFFVEIARYRQRMRRAAEERDSAGLRTAAHTLKGSVAMVGARELQAFAARLEQSGDDPAYQQATLAEIGEAAERLRRMLVSRGFLLREDAGTSADKDTIA